MSEISAGRNKALLQLSNSGKSILQLSIESLLSANVLDGLIVCARASEISEINSLLEQMGPELDFAVVEGGDTRQESVYRGLCACEGRADYVLIHDAARPFCRVDDIRLALTHAKKTGACILAQRIKSSLKSADHGFVIKNYSQKRYLGGADAAGVSCS